jgi:DNA helicase MCM9
VYNGHPLLCLAMFVVSTDDVIITGILSAKWSPDIKDVRSNLDPMLLANYVR